MLEKIKKFTICALTFDVKECGCGISASAICDSADVFALVSSSGGRNSQNLAVVHHLQYRKSIYHLEFLGLICIRLG
jgi:hypothetical protein